MLDAGYWILGTGSWFHPLQLLILLFPMAVAVVLDETVEDDDVDDDVAGPTKQFFRNEMSWACHPLPLPLPFSGIAHPRQDCISKWQRGCRRAGIQDPVDQQQWRQLSAS